MHTTSLQLGKISSGSFGLVHVARDIVTEEEVAIKLIPRGPTITKNVENEILILRRLNHFHTVKLKRVIVTQKYLGIVMEYCPRGDMYELVRRTTNGFDEDTCDTNWCRALARCVTPCCPAQCPLVFSADGHQR